jgi:hypothetical protein
MHGTGDLRIFFYNALCKIGERGLADYGHLTMFLIRSLIGQVLCIHCTICSNREAAMERDGVGK